MQAGGDGLVYIAPGEDALPSVRQWLGLYRVAHRRLRVATPTAIRAALMTAGAADFAAAALSRLPALDPSLSARRVATLSQSVSGGAILVVLAGLISAAPSTTLLALNAVAATLFFGVTALRFIAAHRLLHRRPARPRLARTDDPDLPIYTVLVPLLREERMVGDLVAALDLLDWPKDRLDIKLIVEADDLPTRRAVARTISGAPYEVVVVPPGGPRTKPKALAYALTFARGGLLTVYDAEDRPHPQQLREALAAFQRAEPAVVCLQAPIVVNNRRASAIARAFAVEYSALFDGLLPALASLRLPLPLGGTSNHFRRDALEAIGGWDPYNVTEDADIGIRLPRFGFRSQTLTLPTYEEAPVAMGQWLRQRTRWFKGWVQTWLVHMRNPMRLIREIGFRQFIGFNLVGVGLIVSALLHPVYLATLFIAATNPLVLWGDGSVIASAIVGLNLFNLVAGYFAVALLSRRTLVLRKRGADAWALFGLPIYWLMMSLACLRAFGQLVVRPHHWEKTPTVAVGGARGGR